MENISELTTVLITKPESDEKKNVDSSSQVARIDIPMRKQPDFEFLDEFIRFDVTRTGIYCCSGYEISVQYDDYFVQGKSESLCCTSLISSDKKTISLMYDSEAFLHVKFSSPIFCNRKKNRSFAIKSIDESTQFGMVRYKKYEHSVLEVENEIEKCSFKTEKLEQNLYSISCDDGTKVASITIYRGFRGGISTYGLTFISDTSPLSKALLIALTLVMDIREREAEMTCCFCYIPLISTIVIVLFVLLPFFLIYEQK